MKGWQGTALRARGMSNNPYKERKEVLIRTIIWDEEIVEAPIWNKKVGTITKFSIFKTSTIK